MIGHRRRLVLVAIAFVLAACTDANDSAKPAPAIPPTTTQVSLDIRAQAVWGNASALVADFDGDGSADTMTMYNDGLWTNIEDWYVDLELATGERQTMPAAPFQTGVTYGFPVRLLQVADLAGRPAKAAWAAVGLSAFQREVALLVVHEGRLQAVSTGPDRFGSSFPVGGPGNRATGGVECVDGASTIVVYYAGKDYLNGGYLRTATTLELHGATYQSAGSEPFEDDGSGISPHRSLKCPPVPPA